MLNEDRFGIRILFDSGRVVKGDPPNNVAIDIRQVDCLYLRVRFGDGATLL